MVRSFIFFQKPEDLLPTLAVKPPEFKTINRATESINLPNWNIRGQLGAAIFVGYGSDFFEMLNSGGFKQISTLTNISPPENLYARFNGLYTCYNEYYSRSKVIATFSDNNASVDTSEIYTIPDYTINVQFNKINSSGNRQYDNSSGLLLSLKVVTLNTNSTSDFPLMIGYASSSYNIQGFACKKD